MKSILSIVRRPALALFAALTLTTLFGAAQSARAQIRPFVDCVEKVDNASYRAYYGYVSLYAGNITYPVDSPDNYFTPVIDPPGQPRVFLPGIHRRAVSVVVPNNVNETWVLEGNYAEATAGQTLFPCADAGSNTRTITYQGRLTDANAAGNGQYDLRFQLFNQAVNGRAESTMLELDSVPVVNGIFTVQLDFGLPTFLGGGNLFVEIGVRPGAATGSTPYTMLTPRQPLTAAPYAIRAQSATNADLLGGLNAADFIRNGVTAQRANFNIYGNGIIDGNLTVTGAIDGTVTNATNANNTAQLGGIAANQYLTTANANSNFIQNTTTQQTGNFNVSGSGTVGGALFANEINSATGYNISGSRVLSVAGTNNLFAGINAGTANTTGYNNTIIGDNANVGAGNLNFATAVGSGAIVRTSNTIALGREEGFDLVRIFRLGSAGITPLCLSAVNEISNCSSSLRYKTNIEPFNFGLSIINQLRPISFDWKDGGIQDVGFGAEDVARINSLLVNYNKQGQVEGVKYDRLSVLFVNAFKEQQAQIEQQKIINQTLQMQAERRRQEINQLKAIVCSLKTTAALCKEK